MNKFSLLDEINFHDGMISSYRKEDNNIIFIIDDGWIAENTYEIKLIDVSIQIQKYDDQIILYTIDCLNNINNDSVWLYSCDYGHLDNNKFYLKLWIRYPFGDETSYDETEDFIFDNLKITLSDDYDDEGQIFIKFIASDIEIKKIK